MRTIILLIITVISFVSDVQGQKIFCSSDDSVFLIDVVDKRRINLLPKEKTLGWTEGKFVSTDSARTLYRYKICKNKIIVKHFVFDTLTYNLISQEEYLVSENKIDKYCYIYNYKDSQYRYNNSILKKTGDGVEVFIHEEDTGRTQIRYKNGFEISDNQLICERWHVRRHSDKLRVEPVQIIAVDIATKQMTPLVKGTSLYLSDDNRYALYLSDGEHSERYGVYDIQNGEVVCKFNANYARWVQNLTSH